MSTETGSWKTLEQSYGFFAKGLEYPDPEFWGGIEGKALGELALLDDDAGYANGAADECFPPRDQQDREVEYVSTFDGRSLQQYEGSCRPRVGRDGILEEVLRFYHHFGLKLNEARRDFPDNFITELEFMGHLLRRLVRVGAMQRRTRVPSVISWHAMSSFGRRHCPSEWSG